ncbi:MAG: hypothetical protein ACI9MR_000864 [Myxococcota bacterium]|jgi:hypothetical protein
MSDSAKLPSPTPPQASRSVGSPRQTTTRTPALPKSTGYAVQAEFMSPAGGGGGLRPSGDDAVQTALDGTSGGGVLPHLDAIQASFGRHDVSGVSAAVGGAATEASQALGANAYAVGDQVAFAQAPSLHLAAHEAAHVVQQRAGVSLSGAMGQAGDRYERHADAVADAVVQRRSAEPLLDEMAPAEAPAAKAAHVQRKEKDPTKDPTKDPHSDLVTQGEFERALHVKDHLFRRPLDLTLLMQLIVGQGLADEYFAAHQVTLVSDIIRAVPAGDGLGYGQTLLVSLAETGGVDLRHQVAVALGYVLANKPDGAKVCALIEGADPVTALKLHDEFEMTYRDALPEKLKKRLLAHKAYLEFADRPPTLDEIEGYTTKAAVLKVTWLAAQLGAAGDDKTARKLVMAFSRAATVTERETALGKTSAFREAIGKDKLLLQLMQQPALLADELNGDAESEDAVEKDTDDVFAVHGMKAAMKYGDDTAILETLEGMRREQAVKYLASHLGSPFNEWLVSPPNQAIYTDALDRALSSVEATLQHGNENYEQSWWNPVYNKRIRHKIARIRNRFRYGRDSSSAYLTLAEQHRTEGLEKEGVIAALSESSADDVVQIKQDKSLWKGISKLKYGDVSFAEKLSILAGDYDFHDRDNKSKTMEENAAAVKQGLQLDPRRYALKLDHKVKALSKHNALDAEMTMYGYVQELNKAVQGAEIEGADPVEVEQTKRQFVKAVFSLIAKGTRSELQTHHLALFNSMRHGTYEADPMALLDTAIKEGDTDRIGAAIAAITDSDILAFSNVAQFVNMGHHASYLVDRLDDLRTMAEGADAQEGEAIKLAISNIHQELFACLAQIERTPLSVSASLDAKLNNLSLAQQLEVKLTVQRRMLTALEADTELLIGLEGLGIQLTPAQLVAGESVLLLKQQELARVHPMFSLLIQTADTEVAAAKVLQALREGQGLDAQKKANKGLGKANAGAMKRKSKLAKTSGAMAGKLTDVIWGLAFGSPVSGAAVVSKMVVSWIASAVGKYAVEGQAYDGLKARNELAFNVVTEVFGQATRYFGTLIDAKDGTWREGVHELVGNKVLAEAVIAEIEALGGQVKDMVKDGAVEGQNPDEIRQRALGAFKKRWRKRFAGQLPAAQLDAFFEAHVKAFKTEHVSPGDDANMLEKGAHKYAGGKVDNVYKNMAGGKLDTLNADTTELLLGVEKTHKPAAGDKKQDAPLRSKDDSGPSPERILRDGTLAEVAKLLGVISDDPEAVAQKAKALGNYALAKNVYRYYVFDVVSGKLPKDIKLLREHGLSENYHADWFAERAVNKTQFRTIAEVKEAIALHKQGYYASMSGAFEAREKSQDLNAQARTLVGRVNEFVKALKGLRVIAALDSDAPDVVAAKMEVLAKEPRLKTYQKALRKIDAAGLSAVNEAKRERSLQSIEGMLETATPAEDGRMEIPAEKTSNAPTDNSDKLEIKKLVRMPELAHVDPPIDYMD